jgi:sulfur carrier protein
VLTSSLTGAYDAGMPAREAEQIVILVNGEQRPVPAGLTVADLLRDLDIRPDRVAVELNLQILDRHELDRQSLKDGDRLEVISFIGGGSRSGCIGGDLRNG